MPFPYISYFLVCHPHCPSAILSPKCLPSYLLILIAYVVTVFCLFFTYFFFLFSKIIPSITIHFKHTSRELLYVFSLPPLVIICPNYTLRGVWTLIPRNSLIPPTHPHPESPQGYPVVPGYPPSLWSPPQAIPILTIEAIKLLPSSTEWSEPEYCDLAVKVTTYC